MLDANDIQQLQGTARSLHRNGAAFLQERKGTFSSFSSLIQHRMPCCVCRADSAQVSSVLTAKFQVLPAIVTEICVEWTVVTVGKKP